VSEQIQRFSPGIDYIEYSEYGMRYPRMEPDIDGEFVRLSDHDHELAGVREQLKSTEQAAERLAVALEYFLGPTTKFPDAIKTAVEAIAAWKARKR